MSDMKMFIMPTECLVTTTDVTQPLHTVPSNDEKTETKLKCKLLYFLDMESIRASNTFTHHKPVVGAYARAAAESANWMCLDSYYYTTSKYTLFLHVKMSLKTDLFSRLYKTPAIQLQYNVHALRKCYCVILLARWKNQSVIQFVVFVIYWRGLGVNESHYIWLQNCDHCPYSWNTPCLIPLGCE